MTLQRIDFAPRRGVPGWLLAAAGVAALMAAWSAWELVATQRAAAQARQQASALRAQPAPRDDAAAARAAALPPEQLKAVNEAIQALNVPWPEVLGALEASRGAKVALVRVEPRPKDRVLLVVAQAADMDTLVEHMRQFARTPPFVKATPVRQEVLPEGPGPLRVQASFEARWEDRP